VFILTVYTSVAWPSRRRQALTPLVLAAPYIRGNLSRSRIPIADCRNERRCAEEDLVIVQIFVRDNNVDQALKALKKKMQREGSFREMKRHVHYEKPSEKRARQKAEAVRRARKLARKRLQREGLLPAPKKVIRA
jgi:small subunit ribosomal protein S21